MNTRMGLAEILSAKDEITLDEYNAFINENKIRSNFYPIMLHLKKLTKEFTVDEFCDKVTNETSGVTFSTKIENIDRPFSIDGQVSYDQFSKDAKETNRMSYDIWWGEENYSHFYTPIQMMNWLSHLFDSIKLPDEITDTNRSSFLKKHDSLIPLI